MLESISPLPHLDDPFNQQRFSRRGSSAFMQPAHQGDPLTREAVNFFVARAWMLIADTIDNIPPHKLGQLKGGQHALLGSHPLSGRDLFAVEQVQDVDVTFHFGESRNAANSCFRGPAIG